MTTLNGKTVQEYGLTEVYSAINPLVDIVFVHGLNGHPLNTWSTTKPDVFWPLHLLPLALEEQRPRILTYGYDANVTAFTDGVSKDKIHNHAEHLASRLVANRSLRKAQERPIIFVCHSLGGLVVKRCLIYCNSIRRHQQTERLRSIYVSTYGILFLGTPHNGSDLAKWGSLLQRICSVALPKKFFDSAPQLVQALRTNNETLQNINRHFIEIISRFHVYFFHESKPTDLKGTREFIVEEDSAAPVIEGVERMGIERDHSHMCKFEDESSPGYDVVAEAIQRYSEESQSRIRTRWEEEKRVSEFERQAAARELIDSLYPINGGPSGSITPAVIEAEPSSSMNNSVVSIQPIEKNTIPAISTGLLLVAPVGFRPNSMFFGFQLELDQVVQKLGNQKRRTIGTSAVLLWGPPGSGKSQIAREYLWRYRKNYPAGCFWVDCKTKESRTKSFWEIAQAVAILGVDKPDDASWDEPTKFIHAVRKWFEAREGWLIVFDGVTTDTDDDINEFVAFIPDRSGNDIVYTSVDRTLAKRQRLLNPAGVKVFTLSQHDACAILYKNLGIKEPTSSQSKKALQLVKHYECLPLAVHAASHVLIARGTSLEKYAPGVSDHRLADPFLDIMSALREHSHSEAVNLVTILSFFAHSVPVALLRFGIPALLDVGVDIRSVESMGSMKKELENTIATLIRYGLVERTLLEYSVTSPTRSSSPEELRHRASTISTIESGRHIHLLRDSSNISIIHDTPGHAKGEESSQQSVTFSIDILRIHTVVQTVLRDELRFRYADQPAEYWWWLNVATRFLCHSYALADEKIRSSEGRGLVRDYRDYETQAARLWSHFPKTAEEAPSALRKARHRLHETIRAIKAEIKSQSPSQSINSIQHRVQVSVFERANSTSSESPESDSGLTRTSTWTLENTSESPIQMYRRLDFDDDENSEASWTDKWSQSGMNNSRLINTSGLTTRRPSDTEPTSTDTGSRRSSFLQAIFQGRPQLAKKSKDLGEWKPLPAAPSLSQDQAQMKSRASSFTSGFSDDRVSRPTAPSSEATAALAAVHRASPPTSRGGKVKSSTRPQSLDRLNSDDSRPVLASRSVNTILSPLATTFRPGRSTEISDVPSCPRRRSKNPSSSPRLVETALANQTAVRTAQPLQVEENISVTRRAPAQSSIEQSSRNPKIVFGSQPSLRELPSGYTSQPMSRDTSRESHASLATAPPAVPGSASLSSSPQIRQPYLYSRPGLASIDVVAANLWGLGAAAVDEFTEDSPLVSSLVFEGNNIFERYQEREGSVQFGQMSPVEIDQARLRALRARENNPNDM